MKTVLEIFQRVKNSQRHLDPILEMQRRMNPFIELQESISILKINQLSKAYSMALQFQDLLKNIEEVKGKFEEKDKMVSEVFERYEPFIRQKGIGLKHKEIFEKCFNEMPFDAYLGLTDKEIYEIIRDYAKNEIAKYGNDWNVEEKDNKNKRTKVNDFDNLFPNEESKEFIIKSMIDLKIMNQKHEYILGSERGFLKLFIQVMQENGKIPNMKETPLCKIFADKFNLPKRLSTMNEIKIKQERRKIESYLIGLKK